MACSVWPCIASLTWLTVSPEEHVGARQPMCTCHIFFIDNDGINEQCYYIISRSLKSFSIDAIEWLNQFTDGWDSAFINTVNKLK